MAKQIRTQPLVQITDPDFAAGFDEAQLPCYADCAYRHGSRRYGIVSQTTCTQASS
jgi:hypothetical protein